MDKDLATIEKKYKELSTEKLVSLAKKPEELKTEVIPVLQKELISRGENDEALKLTEYLVKRPNYRNLSSEEIGDLVAQRLETGESIESIKIDFKDQGIDIFDTLHNEAKVKEKKLDYLASLKTQGLQEEEIDHKLQETYAFTEEDREVLKYELRQRGKLNLIIGFTIVILMGIALLILMANGRFPSWGALLIIGLGIWRIVVGYEQRK